MKRQMFFAAAFSAALAVSTAAQTGTAQTPSQERTPGQVTVTGCLAQAPSSATGTSGTTGTSALGPEFILKNATIGPSSSASGTGTSGTPASASAAGKSYKLVGGSAADLKDNVNAKVEVRGTIEKPSAMATPPPAGTVPDKDVQTLRVTSVKKIADSCQ